MIKGQMTAWVVSAGVTVTAGAAITASQLINTADRTATSSSSGSSSAQLKATPKPTKEPKNPPSKALTVSRVDVTGLAPGASITRQLAIGNPNNQDVELQSVKTVLSGPSPAPTAGSCTTPADFEVIVSGYNVSTGAGAPVTIAKNSTLNVPVTIRMNNSASRNQDPCKARSWTFTFTATATSK